MKKTINNNTNKLYIFENVKKKEIKKKKFFLSFGCRTNKSKWQISCVQIRKSVVRGL